jgi:hypothetical protein
MDNPNWKREKAYKVTPRLIPEQYVEVVNSGWQRADRPEFTRFIEEWASHNSEIAVVDDCLQCEHCERTWDAGTNPEVLQAHLQEHQLVSQ